MGRGAIARQLRLRVERCDHRLDEDGEVLSMAWCDECRKLMAAAHVLEAQLDERTRRRMLAVPR